MLGLISCQNSQEKDKISGAYEALQLMSLAKSYPDLDIPNQAYGQALKVHANMETTNSRSFDPWEDVGPKNTAGRTLALAINPQADSTVYLGSASGGLWRSRSLGLGESWEYVPTLPGVLGVSSISFAPGDSSIMYIGTGEVYNVAVTGNDAAYRATRGSYGVGILKSEDGGASWSKTLDMSYNNRFGVQSLQVSRQNPDLVLSATTEGIYRTQDGGENWEKVLNLIMATDVEMHRENDQIAIAAFGNLGVGAQGLLRTTDGGDNWEVLNIPGFPDSYNGKIELNSSPADPDLFFASVGNGFSGSDGATWLFRSEDAGVNWTLVNITDYSRWQGWFAHDVAAHPTVRDRIMAIGIDSWISQDAGTNLTQASNGGVTLGTPPITEPDGPTNYSHSDHHVVLFHPNIPDLILLGNDGGLFLVTNNGTNFRSANGGLQTTQFYAEFSVSHLDPNFALGGLQDNSTVVFRGAPEWTRVIGGDGSYTAINFTDDNYVYASWQNLNVRRSQDRGQNFNQGLNIKQGDDFPVFIAPYVISQDNTDVMYAASQYVYKSNDKGSNWQRMNGGQALNGDPIYKVATSPVDENIVMASTAPFNGPSQIYLSIDGALSFVNVGATNMPDRFVNDIVFDPIDPNKVYIAIGGFDNPTLFVSSDLGQNWEPISNGLPQVPGNAIAIDPLNTDFIYFGNDISTYFSADGGNTWEIFQTGVEGSMIVMDLKISPVDRKLWIATHGRGAYRANLAEGSSSSQDITAQNKQWELKKILGNPVQDNRLNLLFSSKQDINLKVQLYNTQGGLLESHQLKLDVADDKLYNLETNDYDSQYIILKIFDGNRTSSHKILYL